MTSIRGAITVENNDSSEIITATTQLLQKIIEENNIQINNIISIIISTTSDLTKVYPARAARDAGITQAGLMCMQEMYVENSLPMCIRVLLYVEWEKRQDEMCHVYLNRAVVLRPDLSRNIAVAIDGPSGAGKSTVAKAIAHELGFIYVDTGAMYRTAALYCLRNNVDSNDADHIEQIINDIHISLKYINGYQHIYLNDEDVTSHIRTREVADASSKFAVNKTIRDKLASLQQEYGLGHNVVMDGRDIAVNVLPWAQVKIYLDASVEVRSRRRYIELKENGSEIDYEKVKADIEERDYRDINRSHSPLRCHKDAIRLDTSDMDFDEVCHRVIEICREVI